MLSFYRKYARTVFDIALIVLTVYLFMLLFSYLYRMATPIFFAFVIYMVIEPLARFLNRRGLKKSLASAISTVLFILLILGALTGAGVIFTTQIISLKNKIPEYASVLQTEIVNRTADLQTNIAALDPDIVNKTKEYAAELTDKLSEFAISFLSFLFNTLTSFSTFMVNFTIGIILAYFLSIEIETWKKLAVSKTPKTFKAAFFFLKENVLIGIVSYLKAQLKLITLTFILILISLLILGIKNSFSIAMLSAIFDLLPLLGVSTIFIPWIVYLFIVGNTALAIKLIVVLAIVIVVRQILEPKITGESLGVSAFTMLSFMIISLSLFGVAGLILSPILIILLKALYEQGHLQRWIHKPEEEYPNG